MSNKQDSFRFSLECTNISSTPYSIVKILRPWKILNNDFSSLKFVWEIHAKVQHKNPKFRKHYKYEMSKPTSKTDSKSPEFTDNDLQNIEVGETVTGKNLFFKGEILVINITFFTHNLINKKDKQLNEIFIMLGVLNLKVWFTYICKATDNAVLSGQFRSSPVFVTISKS